MLDADTERCRIFKRIRRKLELCELEDMTSIALCSTAANSSQRSSWRTSASIHPVPI